MIWREPADSVELDHRLQAESLIPRVDLVVWVADPEKYRDAALHHDHLAPLAAHADRFLFVLNQIDRIDPNAVETLLSDLQSAITHDGFAEPEVFGISAAPQAGPPLGVDRLMAELESRRSTGVLAKALIDLDEAARSLIAKIGGSGLDFDRRAAEVAEAAAAALSADDRAGAVDVVANFLDDVAKGVGGMAETRIRSVAATTPRRLGSIELEDLDARSVDRAVIEPVRVIIRERATAIAAVTDLSLTVASSRRSMGV